MVAEMRGLRHRCGLRGAPRGDLEALAQAVARRCRSWRSDPTVVEAEANPVLVLAEGRGCRRRRRGRHRDGAVVTGVVAALGARAVALRANGIDGGRRTTRRAPPSLDWFGVTLGGSRRADRRRAARRARARRRARAVSSGAPTACRWALAALVNGSAVARPRTGRHLRAGTVPPGRAGRRGRARRRRPARGHVRRPAPRGRRRLRGGLPCRGRPRPVPLRALAHDGHRGRDRRGSRRRRSARPGGGRRSRTRLSLAATTAGGLQQTFRSDAAGKPLHAGAAAQAGVVAVAAAAGGVTGAGRRPRGAGRPRRGDRHVDGLVREPGGRRPSARDRAGDRQAVPVLRTRVRRRRRARSSCVTVGSTRRRVRAIAVETYATALATAGIAAPRTDAERRFSIGHLVAAALVFGAEGMFAPRAAADPARRRPGGTGRARGRRRVRGPVPGTPRRAGARRRRRRLEPCRSRPGPVGQPGTSARRAAPGGEVRRLGRGRAR